MRIYICLDVCTHDTCTGRGRGYKNYDDDDEDYTAGFDGGAHGRDTLSIKAPYVQVSEHE